MKAYVLRGKWALLVGVMGLSVLQVAVAEDSVKIGGSVGLVLSSGYNDTLDTWAAANNMEATGGYGWLDFGLRVDVPVAQGVSIVPAGDILVNFVSGDGDSSAVNWIILPSVSAKYQFGEGSGPYIQAGINYGIVNMGIDGWDVKADGIGLQVQGGYRFGSGFAVELGYVQIPVSGDVPTSYRYRNMPVDEDFGGIQVRGAFFF